MNTEHTIIYHHIKSENKAGNPVTYTSIVKGRVLDRSDPTVFKVIREMLADGTLRGEYMPSDSGHTHMTLFVNDGNEMHTDHLIRMLYAEFKKMRLSTEAFMMGELVKPKETAKWRRIDDIYNEIGNGDDPYGRRGIDD